MIEKLLTKDRIAIGVHCDSWKDAVKASGELLVKARDIDEPFIASMIDVVKEFGPYMILAPEVAFFHGRPSESVHRTCISLITLSKPVVFEEYDGEVIKCAFAFGAMDSESHLEVLKSVAILLQNSEFLDLVRNVGSKDEILNVIKRVCN